MNIKYSMQHFLHIFHKFHHLNKRLIKNSALPYKIIHIGPQGTNKNSATASKDWSLVYYCCTYNSEINLSRRRFKKTHKSF